MSKERIAVVTDSTSDLSDAALAGQDIFRIPLRVYFGNEEYWDRENLTPEQFYARLQSDKNFPRTTPPTSKRFMELFQKLIAEGYTHVLCIFISGVLSKTGENARFAANLATQLKIAIVDSKTTAYGLGALCLYACTLIRQGQAFDAVVEKIQAQVPKTLIVFSVDNLTNLERGGRVSKAKAFFGNLLGVRPILALKEGTGMIEPVSTVNSSEAANEQMAGLAAAHYKKHGAKQGVCLLHADASGHLPGLKKLLLDQGIKAELLHESRIGSVVGSHLGSTGWGIGLC